MSDLIYRQDAIDALCNSFCGGHHDCEFYPECGNLEDIQAVPSAEKVQLSGEDATFDCISRQDAIDAIHEDADWLAAQGSDWQVERMERDKSILMSLPSAEPEIIRCRDCKHHDGIRCFRWNSTIITGFDDFCSNAERRTDE